MDNMILGRYIPGNSIVHRLDPRSKLVAMILLIMIVFWANNPITNVILFVVTGIFVALSEVPLSFFIKGYQDFEIPYQSYVFFPRRFLELGNHRLSKFLQIPLLANRQSSEQLLIFHYHYDQR